MGVFDIGTAQGYQSAASSVASALVPKKTAAQSLATPATAVKAKDTSTTSTTDTDNSTITSNDFLTLLVTELKNQDPTQPTDPNAYITQLVGVNSLQQLISINQGITSLDGTATTSGTTSGATQAAAPVGAS